MEFLSTSKTISPPAAPATASYFLVRQEVTKKRCTTATPDPCGSGPLRVSVAPESAELALVATLPPLKHAAAFFPARPAMLGAADGEPSASKAPRSAGPGGRRRAACLSAASSARPARAEHRREPGKAGRRRGTSVFAYFCGDKSRSHQPAKLAAKRFSRRGAALLGYFLGRQEVTRNSLRNKRRNAFPSVDLTSKTGLTDKHL